MHHILLCEIGNVGPFYGVLELLSCSISTIMFVLCALREKGMEDYLSYRFWQHALFTSLNTVGLFYLQFSGVVSCLGTVLQIFK